MKLSLSAIHEAGHVILAVSNGFSIKEVYISEAGGQTQIEYPSLSDVEQQTVNKLIEIGMSQELASEIVEKYGNRLDRNEIVEHYNYYIAMAIGKPSPLKMRHRNRILKNVIRDIDRHFDRASIFYLGPEDLSQEAEMYREIYRQHGLTEIGVSNKDETVRFAKKIGEKYFGADNITKIANRIGEKYLSKLTSLKKTSWPESVRADLLGEQKRKILDVYLAGWAAEEAFLSPYPQELLSAPDQVSIVRRAEKDIRDICDIFGLHEYRDIIIPYIIKNTRSSFIWWDTIIQANSHYRSCDNSHLPRNPKVEMLIEEINFTKDMIRKVHFGNRLKKVPLRALAIELTKKRKLLGSQAVDILDKAQKSWRFKWNSFLDDLIKFRVKIITRIPPISSP